MKKIITTIILLFSFCSIYAMGPRPRNLTEERNYVLSLYALIETSSTDTLDVTTSREELTYYDGNGKSVQEILRGAGPEYTDIVTMHEYDAWGRKTRSWLPAKAAGTGAFVDFDSYASYAISLHCGDEYAFSRFSYEDSKLSRELSVSGPGRPWQEVDSIFSYEYCFNDMSDEHSCRKFHVSGLRDNHSLESDGYYDAGKLSIRELNDEDGRTVMEFTDANNRIILTRQVLDSCFADTYYVYDDYGNLCYVMSPEGVTAWEDTSEMALSELCYQYRYDERNRCIAKKLPGADWVYYLYDNYDRVIFSQDGNMRNANQWNLVLYDNFGREAIRAVFYGDASSLGIGDEDMSVTAKDSTNITGYVLPDIINLSDMSLRTVYWYDDYASVPVDSSIIFNFESRDGYESLYTTNTKGLMTGSMIYHEDGTAPLTSIYYYDSKGRNIQMRRSDGYALLTAYDFIGNPIKTYEGNVGFPVMWIETNLSYLHSGLVDKVSVETSGGVSAEINYHYDDLNRLMSISYGNYTENYTYNVRDWLTDKNVTTNSKTIFNMDLRYEEPLLEGSAPEYGGNISELEWIHDGEDSRGYSFAYDEMSRLLEGHAILNGMSADAFSEMDITYDKNGNILTMSRHDADDIPSDIINTYAGNHLLDCTYDSAGNLTYDADSGLAIEWNSLNLIKKVSLNGTTLVKYSYLADGTKVRAVGADGTGLEYRGSLTFTRSSFGRLMPESIAFPGGRFVAKKNDEGLIVMVPHYYITDHLGSVRVVIDGSSDQIVEANDYYPFGGRWDDDSLQDQANRYRYNGKEEQSLFGSAYSDYGARQYSASTGRWLSMDPLSEKYYSVSPYTFCANNPVNLVDPDGRRVRPKSAFELNMIKHTLPNEARNYVRLSSDGYIDYESLTQYKGWSRNFSSLISLVESETTIDVILDNKFVYSDPTGTICESDIMGYNPPDDYFKDTSFKFVSGLYTGESGTIGKTLFPDSDGEQNSPDQNIKVIVNHKLSALGAAESFSHEAYGHALLYINNGGDHNGASHNNVPSELGPYDLSFILKFMILGARRETVENFNN